MIYIVVIVGDEVSIMFVKADNQEDAEKLAGVDGLDYYIQRLSTSILLTLQENKQALIIP